MHKQNGRKKGRRRFLKTVALGAGVAALPAGAGGTTSATGQTTAGSVSPGSIDYPRTFSGPRRKMISFPLGGIGTGSIGLGGRGQLRDWQIFNRPDKGNSPAYAFPSIWVQSGSQKSISRVLEARILPPYEGTSGLGSANVPGLPRLASSVFTGGFPLAQVDFEDSTLPVHVSLDAFSPFIPLDADDSGLPVALLRYRVVNPSTARAIVSIAFSIDNPVGKEGHQGVNFTGSYGRQNEYRQSGNLQGLLMRNPFLTGSHPLAGSFVLGVLGTGDGKLTYLRGWASGRWWESPLLFWDDFTADGALGPEAPARTAVGAVCLQREVPPRSEAEFRFILAWHFPNRTPARCGWSSPKGHENDLIGNHYCSRFRSAWEAAEYAAEQLPRLDRLTRKFAAALRETRMPAEVKDAASANLSTLVTQTSLRIQDGSYHGFEGCDDQAGCCFGSCTHVYAYEAAIENLFPQLSRSMREQQFGFLTDAEGRMDYRELLPFGIERFGIAAADGQMACLMKLYLDWRLSGDTPWLRQLWPNAKRALEFAWIAGGWDANRDGVMEGAQHNTYDVEFIGPNPLCQLWYLGALRACEEMAQAAGDPRSAGEYRRLFESGSRWMDEHLFNGEYYIQQVGSVASDQIARGLMEGAGPANTENPTFQVGSGCLSDQLVGQYYSLVAGLGLLLDRNHILKTLRSIYKYNYKQNLSGHASVQRTYALNDEAGLVICTYPKGSRPRTPFPYFAEVWTGIEYAVSALMLYVGMVPEGLEVIKGARRRYDGERRNPWDEAECGYHYTRPMASWAGLVALSGFHYDGVEKRIAIKPGVNAENFTSFWSSAEGWGSFSQQVETRSSQIQFRVASGRLRARSLALATIPTSDKPPAAKLENRALTPILRRKQKQLVLELPEEVEIQEGEKLSFSL